MLKLIRIIVASLLFTSLFCFSTNTLGIVQVNDVVDAKEGVSGNLRLSINGQSGNKVEQEFGFDTLLRFRAEENLVVFLGDYSYSETNDIKDEDELFAHLRWVRLNQFAQNLDSELFLQYQYDDFADLSRRELVGGNIRYRFISESAEIESQFTLGAGLFHETEESEITDLEDDTVRVNIYSRFVYQRKTEFPFSVYLSTYLQPAVDDINDLRGLAVAGIEFEILENIFIAFDVEVKHNARPFTDVKKTDVDYGLSLKYQF